MIVPMAADFLAELKAIKALVSLMDQASECRALYESAGLPIPERLQALLDGKAAATNSPDQEVVEGRERPTAQSPDQLFLLVPSPPQHGQRPTSAAQGWVSLKARDASPLVLTMAVLRDSEAPMRKAEISKRVGSIRGTDNTAAYNAIGQLVGGGSVLDTHEGIVVNTSLGAVLAGEWVWCDKEHLNDSDRAAIRREAILMILERNASLTTADVSRAIQLCDWLPVEATKDTTKADLASLEKDRKIRRLADLTWEVIRQD